MRQEEFSYVEKPVRLVVSSLLLITLVLSSEIAVYNLQYYPKTITPNVRIDLLSEKLVKGQNGAAILEVTLKNTGTRPVEISGAIISNAAPISLSGSGTVESGQVLVQNFTLRPVASFDGSTSYVEIPNAQSLNPSSFSVELMLQYSSIQSPGQQLVIGKGSSGSTSFYFFTSTPVSTWNDFVLYVNQTRYDHGLGNTLRANAWYDVVFTLNNSGVGSYVNGIQYSWWPEAVQFLGNSRDLLIGKCGCGNYFFNGSLAFVKMYDRSLNPKEVMANYQQPSEPIKSGLVMWLAFDMTNSTTVSDISGEGNNGFVFGNVQRVYPQVGSGSVVIVTAVSPDGLRYSTSATLEV